jgi:hypothetical protein
MLCRVMQEGILKTAISELQKPTRLRSCKSDSRYTCALGENGKNVTLAILMLNWRQNSFMLS